MCAMSLCTSGLSATPLQLLFPHAHQCKAADGMVTKAQLCSAVCRVTVRHNLKAKMQKSEMQKSENASP